MLNVRQEKFCLEFMKCGNATEAMVKAGYSEKFAGQNADKLLKNTNVQTRLAELRNEAKSASIADITEVMEYLTRGMRQELEEEVVAFEDGTTRIVNKKISIRDSNKCAELLGKRFGIFTEKVNLNGNVGVTIIDDLGE
jgi:phage terminase small subunit